MKQSIALKEERASLITELEGLVNTASTEEREFTETEETRQGDLNESIYALDAKIAKAEKSEQILARNLAGAASKSDEVEMDNHAKQYSLQSAVEQFRMGGRLEGREAEMQQEAMKEYREAGIAPTGHIQIPMGITYRASGDVSAFAATTGTAEQPVLPGLVPESVIEQAGANRITGVAGTVRLPALPSDATAIKGEEVAMDPGAEMAAVDIAPVRMASRIDVSNQMLAASTNTFDSVVAAQFRRHSGGLLDKQAWTNFVAQGAEVLRSTTAAAAVPAIDFASANDLIAALGAADALDNSAAFFSAHGQLATARSQQAVTNGGIPTLQTDGTIAGYKAYGHSQITADLIADTARTTDGVFVGGDDSTAITNEASMLPFFLVNMNDVYCCYWGGADLVVDNMSQAHAGVTRLIMNYYANCKVGHGASAKYVVVA
jgi:hypothetical protein